MRIVVVDIAEEGGESMGGAAWYFCSRRSRGIRGRGNLTTVQTQWRVVGSATCQYIHSLLGKHASYSVGRRGARAQTEATRAHRRIKRRFMNVLS